MEFPQFKVLPFGSLLIPLTIVGLWRLWSHTTRESVYFVAVMGIAGGAVLVAPSGLCSFFLQWESALIAGSKAHGGTQTS